MMAENNRFDQVRIDMEERKKKAMERSADLKTEVEKAINDLQKSQLSDQERYSLVRRFSEVSHIAGVDRLQIEDLIQVFSELDAKYEATAAIDNLKRILHLKDEERREFENQTKHK